ncbi:MAG: DNA mismatch repair protein MutS [Candidatus Acetothermia bacterium]|nr:DNA mismatch repair protein MutS [Candidatus Acetothermia bacterium]MDH7506066.1 DNA mismatch repair protein MutS [Candidatus Acetothermia bacterium]
MAKLTPVMRQYLKIKEQYPDAILFFNLGDFYETFFEDAELASRELELVLTKRNEAPMAGVPIKKAEVYINRLLKKGYKVAICDQLQDPQEARGLVLRDVVRVVTPGTALEQEVLERGLNNYIAAILPQAQGERLGLALADLSTGEFRATELSQDELKAELARLQPAELLLPQGFNAEAEAALKHSDRRVAQTRVEESYFRTEELLEHFGLASLAGLGLSELAGRAAAGLLRYLKETQKENLAHLKRPQAYSVSEQMQLDPFTQRNLELVRDLAGGTQNTLFSVLNRTITGMGERLLRRYLLAPLLDREEIERRLDLVELLFNEGLLRAELREFLKEIHDLERLAGRLGAGRANPRDLLSLGQSLEKLPQLRELVDRLRAAGPSEILEELAATLDRLSLEDLAELLKRALREDAPLALKEGGLIREGFDRELDGLKAQEREYKKKILELEAKERERTGIPSLKVGYNTVFGYYIEVTKTHAKRVPQDYIRKQTLVNAERYITPELKEYEGKITSAAERAVELEYEIFLQLRERVAARVKQIQELAELIARLDAFAALAEVAKSNNYTRPHFTDRPEIEIRDGRHPVVERREEFVPNDLFLKEDEHLVILTGPNMSGKSVYIRQIALIALMAQLGSFVPAREARLPLIDRIFTRVGASDMLASGYSTFMVEMLETANILNNATPRSLIILDEMGRGTSTFDGVSIAWAVAEHLATKVKAKTLFATHYHELTKLAARIRGVKNMHVRVKEFGNEVIFLHRVAEGVAEGSYGVHVARLAGLPEEVTAKAAQILDQILKNNPLDAMGELRGREPRFLKQLALFAAEEHPVIKRLKGLDLEKLTPLEALELLAELRRELD